MSSTASAQSQLCCACWGKAGIPWNLVLFSAGCLPNAPSIFIDDDDDDHDFDGDDDNNDDDDDVHNADGFLDDSDGIVDVNDCVEDAQSEAIL